MKKMLYRIIVKSALRLHTLFYKLSSFVSNKLEGGVHPKHNLMGYHKFFLDNINHGQALLDIGCGNGALTFELSKKAGKIVAIDLSKKNIQFAKNKFFAPNVGYIAGDALNYEFKENFDAIILSNVLEHINDRTEFLCKVKKLAPKILIRVPMINRDWITLYKKELGLEYRLDKTHFIEYTLESFKKELERAGFKIYNYNIQFGEIWAVAI